MVITHAHFLMKKVVIPKCLNEETVVKNYTTEGGPRRECAERAIEE